MTVSESELTLSWQIPTPQSSTSTFQQAPFKHIYAQGTCNAKLGCGSSVLGTRDSHQACTTARERAQVMLSRAERAACPSCFPQPGSTRLLPDSVPSLVHFHSLPAAGPGPWGNKTLLLLQYLGVALFCLKTNRTLPKLCSQVANKTSHLWG